MRPRGPVDRMFDFVARGGLRHGRPSIEEGNALAEERAAAMKREAQERARRETVPEGMVEVELHNYAPEAIAATRATIEGLRGECCLLERHGRFFVPDGFCSWAVERQDYVKRVLR